MDSLKITEIENQRMKDEIVNKDIAIMRFKEKIKELKHKLNRVHKRPHKRQHNHSRFFPRG